MCIVVGFGKKDFWIYAIGVLILLIPIYFLDAKINPGKFNEKTEITTNISSNNTITKKPSSKNTVMSEKRNTIDTPYLIKGFDEFDDKYSTFIDENKNNFVKWTAHIKTVNDDKNVTMREGDYPEIKASFNYKLTEFHNVKVGDIITIIGNPVKYHLGIFTTSNWYLANCRIEETTAEEKNLALNYKSIFEEQDKKVQEDEQKIAEKLAQEEADKQAVIDKEAESSKNNKYISGLDAANIKLNLKNEYRMKFSGPSPLPSSEEFMDSASILDAQGNTLNCEFSEKSPINISYVSFTCLGDKYTVKRYLSYCATIPFDKAEPEKARKWVNENYDKAIKGKIVSISFGNARFELSGNPSGMNLSILAPSVE